MRPKWIRVVKTIVVTACLIIASGVGFFESGSLVAEVQEQTVTLQIEGMTCGACIKVVRAALQKVNGVKAVEVQVGTKWFFLNDYSDARASVTFDPGQTAVDALIKAVESASTTLSAYKARLLQAK
jgi:copper chaperone CopZ